MLLDRLEAIRNARNDRTDWTVQLFMCTTNESVSKAKTWKYCLNGLILLIRLQKKKLS